MTLHCKGSTVATTHDLHIHTRVKSNLRIPTREMSTMSDLGGVNLYKLGKLQNVVYIRKNIHVHQWTITVFVQGERKISLKWPKCIIMGALMRDSRFPLLA